MLRALHHRIALAALLAIGTPAVAPTAPPTARLPIGSPAPAWSNTSWLNTDAPLKLDALRGRVVLLNFWVFTCGNCTRTLPSLKQFDAQYRARGLTLVGIHTPEFPPYAGEHDRANVAKALKTHGITYPIAQDNDRATWGLYDIRYWPSFVLIDKQGRIRHTGYGEFHIDDRWHRDWASKIEALLAE
jgi:thiol-disulfide isomerase/thioredoxin